MAQHRPPFLLPLQEQQETARLFVMRTAPPARGIFCTLIYRLYNLTSRLALQKGTGGRNISAFERQVMVRWPSLARWWYGMMFALVTKVLPVAAVG